MAVFVAAMLVAGCGQATVPTAAPTPTPTVARTPTLAPSPIPSPTRSPSPTAIPTPVALAFPTRSEVELEDARYSSSPPFDIPFTFQIPTDGWYSAHLHAEFLDVIRIDGPNPHEPTSWLAWAHPDTVHGADAEIAAGMTPEEAAATVATNDDLVASATRPFEFAGLTGVQLDVHTDSANVPVFGGPDGDFGLQPSHDARLGFVTIGEELVIVMCLGAPDELDEACADVQPILDTVQL